MKSFAGGEKRSGSILREEEDGKTKMMSGNEKPCWEGSKGRIGKKYDWVEKGAGTDIETRAKVTKKEWKKKKTDNK